ncbi:hypothetical protein FRX31_012267 [Thalictrum thalictroides]|uniref:Uncharacterized protein n=1 Tax=Thalictrum thalictroides TaxID=46969 RepID=A0A7J6WLA2_THATH|nr:hypothetical protein FRX31_012267 [Thalictrum thalictroides]
MKSAVGSESESGTDYDSLNVDTPNTHRALMEISTSTPEWETSGCESGDSDLNCGFNDGEL